MTQESREYKCPSCPYLAKPKKCDPDNHRLICKSELYPICIQYVRLEGGGNSATRDLNLKLAGQYWRIETPREESSFLKGLMKFLPFRKRTSVGSEKDGEHDSERQLVR